MREILFRGRSPITGQWIYGDLFQHGEQAFIMADNRNTEVSSETVGQFTGLTDRNGVKIFEGDIVEYEGKRYSINYLTHYARFSAVKPNTVFCVFAYQRGEVIGNIYDNPELIGGAEYDT